MHEFIEDANGNRAYIHHFGTEAAARSALESCKGCKSCVNCSNCSNCSRCSRCSDCSGCSRVRRALGPVIAGPTRSDGYQFVLGADGRIHAGCRVLDGFAEARNHWNDTRGGTPLGGETTRILDYLERKAACRKAAAGL